MLDWPADRRIQRNATLVQLPLFRLAPAELVEISGADALAFANSQFSSDVNELAVGQWQWSAWLDPQGRVRSFFLLLRPAQDQLLAWLGPGDANEMRKQLALYVLRSKVNLVVPADWTAYAVPPAAVADKSISTDNGGWSITLSGSRRLLLAPTIHADAPDNRAHVQQWCAADIAAGLPWLAPALSGQFNATALGLARLDATSLRKGCYPGQEIVARLHYRGGNKRHVWQGRVDSPTPPEPGTRIISSDDPARSGQLLYAAATGTGWCEALMLLPEPVDTNCPLHTETGAAVQAVQQLPDRAT